MPKIKISTKLKDEFDNFIGQDMQCVVLDEKHNFKKKPNGDLLFAIISDTTRAKTLQSVICESLLVEKPDKPLTGAEKSKRYELWNKVKKGKAFLILRSDEIVIIKGCIGAIQPILIFGQCEVLLEG